MVWMSQPVWLGEFCPRKKFIAEFAQSIRQFMGPRGYKMEDRLEKELALWMYRIHIQETCRKKHGAPVELPEIEHRDTQDDYDQFCQVLGQQEVEKFMKLWSANDTNDLLADTHVGNRIRYGLEEFLYRVIHIEASKQGRFIASLWDTSGTASESEMYDSAKKDVYLEDATKGYHGGRGSKV